MASLVQLRHPTQGRRAGFVEGDRLRLLLGVASAYQLAQAALSERRSLADCAAARADAETLDYGTIHHGESEWRLLPAFDHPDEPSRCLVTGTGLTHMKSAQNRQAMHEQARAKNPAAPAAEKPVPTDSMRMYQLGLEGGRPPAGTIGVAPEWFYKGCGTILRAHGEPLEVPPYARDGGEEAEVAGIYLIDLRGTPRRIGLAQANEFSDHQMEQLNYLYLAPSKLRTCAIGPELLLDGDFQDVGGTARVVRGGKTLWSREIATGEQNMSHTVANLEHHHFKYAAHRRPGDVHIHFFGADAFSFGEGIQLADGDIMEIEFAGFGRPLVNPIKIDRSAEKWFSAARI
jgi:hypothetical protein